MKRLLYKILVVIMVCVALMDGCVNAAPMSKLRGRLESEVEKGKGTLQLSSFIKEYIDQVRKYVPDSLAQFIESVRLTDAFFTTESPEKGAIFQVVGRANFGSSTIDVRFVCTENKDSSNMILELLPPDAWKMSALNKKLGSLDDLNFIMPRIIIPLESYKDESTNNIELKGLSLNIIAGVNFEHPLFKNVEKMITSLSVGGIATSLDIIYAHCIVPPTIIGTQIDFVLPARIGLDLQKMYTAGKFPYPPRLFSRITTDTIVMSVYPFELRIDGETGVRFYPLTQDDSFALRGRLSVDPSGFSIKSFMEEPYDPAFGVSWLALSDFSVAIDFDYRAAAATGGVIPVRGIDVSGGLRLGEVVMDMRADIGFSRNKKPEDATSAVVLAAATIPDVKSFDVSLYGALNKLSFSDLFAFFQKIVRESGSNITWSDMPTMELSDVRFEYCIAKLCGSRLPGQ